MLLAPFYLVNNTLIFTADFLLRQALFFLAFHICYAKLTLFEAVPKFCTYIPRA